MNLDIPSPGSTRCQTIARVQKTAPVVPSLVDGTSSDVKPFAPYLPRAPIDSIASASFLPFLELTSLSFVPTNSIVPTVPASVCRDIRIASLLDWFHGNDNVCLSSIASALLHRSPSAFNLLYHHLFTLLLLIQSPESRQIPCLTFAHLITGTIPSRNTTEPTVRTPSRKIPSTRSPRPTSSTTETRPTKRST